MRYKSHLWHRIDIGYEAPDVVVNRLKYYFFTYKDLPGNVADVEITHTYGAEERELIKASMNDYRTKFKPLVDSASSV